MRAHVGLRLAQGSLLSSITVNPCVPKEMVKPSSVWPAPSQFGWLRRAESDANYNTSSSALPTGASQISGQPPPTSTSSPHDPLLAIMPDFAFSMPAQIIVGGVNLALTTMLTIQLIFTMQYHYPLSKRNYILQSCSTLILLISLAVQLHSILSALEHQVHGWPYMFAYIAVQIPPQDGSWTIVEEAFFLVMRAVSTFFIHLTHIQFLTLLFPSALEARLILWMLGPLALAASGMEFTALSSDDDVKTSDLGDAIRNICNSTLFLLYTSGLLVWGLLVNRRRAWRTDGGTAAFGGGSVGLAFINTTVSFVEIAFDRLWWLPDILWTLTLWQSWLGFWWWVGSGMGIGEVEDRVERQERRRKRAEKLRRKRERAEKAKLKAAAKSNNGSGTGSQTAAAAVASSLGENGSDVIRGSIRRITSRFSGTPNDPSRNSNRTGLNRRLRINTDGQRGLMGEEIEMNQANGSVTEGEQLQSIAIHNVQRGDDVQTVAGTGSQSSDTHPTTSAGATSSTGWLSSMADFLAEHQPNFIRRRMRRLRMAHVAAARRAATEQTMLRDQVLNRQSEPMAPGLRTMMFDNRNTPPSPSMGNGNEANSNVGRTNHQRRSQLAFQPSLTTDSSGTSSGRQAVMPILLENDLPRRMSGSASGPNSIHSLSILPDGHSPNSIRRSENQGEQDERRRHSIQNVLEERGELVSGNTNAAHQPDQDGEWIDEDLIRPTSNIVEEDALSDMAQDGEIVNNARPAIRANGQQSWTWRGGLRGVRLRDHTTYDDDDDDDES